MAPQTWRVYRAACRQPGSEESEGNPFYEAFLVAPAQWDRQTVWTMFLRRLQRDNELDLHAEMEAGGALEPVPNAEYDPEHGVIRFTRSEFWVLQPIPPRQDLPD
ncbi:MAG: hypothetical protein K6U14_00235 [Firmicutes bacterium]|nr:hypothetical protein [Alicyclobacillaceae bacterium]MCL6496048.1 hypothetical protein [Bacillota bacterium]